ncbi:MAG: hypothetical protein V7749_08815 [Cocleimonas sp.]
MIQQFNKNTCYVFSDKTLDIALENWLDLKKGKLPKKEESFLITAAALPWFLKHCQLKPPVYMFTFEDLSRNLEAWQASQLEAFPNREERIIESCKLLMDFFKSDVMLDNKMIVQT